jgi:hypothetical protein
MSEANFKMLAVAAAFGQQLMLFPLQEALTSGQGLCKKNVTGSNVCL